MEPCIELEACVPGAHWLRTGEFCKWLGPSSGSPGSLGVRPSLFRSKIALPASTAACISSLRLISFPLPSGLSASPIERPFVWSGCAAGLGGFWLVRLTPVPPAPKAITLQGPSHVPGVTVSPPMTVLAVKFVRKIACRSLVSRVVPSAFVPMKLP